MKITANNCSLVFKKFHFEPTTYDKSSFVADKCLRINGTITNTELFSATDYINIKGATTLSGNLLWGATNLAAICFYDSSKNFISAIYGIEGKDGSKNEAYSISDIPVTAVYCIAGGRTNIGTTLSLSVS